MADLAALLTNTPVPGQSLTRPTSAPLPIELPPEHTEMNETVKWILDDLMSKNKLPALTRVLKEGAVFIDTLTSSLLEEGMLKGKWNADMAHLLIEPVMIMLMWLASQVDAPVKFRRASYYDSTGLDVLSSVESTVPEEVQMNLLGGGNDGQ